MNDLTVHTQDLAAGKAAVGVCDTLEGMDLVIDPVAPEGLSRRAIIQMDVLRMEACHASSCLVDLRLDGGDVAVA